MVSSDARSVDEYLDALDPAVRAEVEPVLERVRAALPDGFVEGMEFGMVAWAVPLSVYPDTYNGRPLMYAALAAQKRYNSLYLMGAYDPDGSKLDEAGMAQRWAGGRPLDMGRSCVRFRRVADLDLDLIDEVLGQWSAPEYVAFAKAQRDRSSRGSRRRS